MFIHILTVSICLPAVYFDIKKREIPNWITLPVIVGGIIAGIFTHGLVEVLVIITAGLVICELLYRTMLGGGDLKLLLGITLWGGIEYGLLVFYFSLVSAVPLFIFYIIKQKSWRASVPYAVAILGGAAITALGGGRIFCL